jgi:Tol biopolymer transport system component
MLFLVYNCSENSNITDSEGSNQQPSVVFDGRQLVTFSKYLSDSSEIYVMDIDGDSSYQLTDNVYNDFNPSFSPGGDKISYISYRDNSYQVRIMNTNGTDDILLFNIAQESSEIPQFTKDQSKIYYYDYSQLHICDIDGNSYIALTISIDYASSFDWVYHNNGITSSKDGSNLLFAARTNNTTNHGIVTYDVNSNSLNTILKDSGDDTEILPVFSNDENFICYRSDNDHGYSDLFIIDKNGGNSFNLTQNRAPSCYAPFYSPDDQFILFMAKPAGFQTIFMVDAQGDSIVQISGQESSAGGGNLVFSSNGNSFYYIEYNKIFRYDFNNHISTNIFTSNNYLDNMAISGDFLFFTTDNGTLVRINLDGSNPKELNDPERHEYLGGVQIQPIKSSI